MASFDNDLTAPFVPEEMRAERIRRNYKKRGVPSSGSETAKLLLERYGPKRDAINQFTRHLQETGGKPLYSDTQLLLDSGVTEAEIESLIRAYFAGELSAM